MIDFWGPGYDIAERMGLLPRIKELGYQVQEVRFVDGHGHTVGGFLTDVFGRLTSGRFTSLRRSDLSAAIYGALDGAVETLFGNSIAGIDEQRDNVRVRFDRAPPRDVGLVIGADGLHSRVRRLAFGPQAQFEVSLGYHVAAFEIEGYRLRDELVYVSHAVPGRQVSRFALRDDKTLFLFVFRDEYLRGMRLSAEDDRKSVLAHVFADLKWECPQILAAMMNVSDVYFDRVSQIRMDQWARGRTALVGDVAACVSLLAGEGTGLAMAEAYVLAAALRDCGGDHVAAIARYQESLMPFLRRKQESAARFASSFVPKTALGIAYRNVVTRLDTWRVVEFNVHHDPAPAICLLVSLYRMRNQQVIVVGLGRELAEAALLRQVEIPIVVRHDSIDQALLMRELPSAYRTSAEALDGWREAVFGIAGE